MFVVVVIFIIFSGSCSKVNIRRCPFFSHVHPFRSYSFSHLDLVKWITLGFTSNTLLKDFQDLWILFNLVNKKVKDKSSLEHCSSRCAVDSNSNLKCFKFEKKIESSSKKNFLCLKEYKPWGAWVLLLLFLLLLTFGDVISPKKITEIYVLGL